ncbi:MAG: hypothetical protein Q4D29_05370 [Lachnospiraceae bacterium]|nr:hypothetical protein [Lachnospiraceae bacterium]
MKKVIGLFSSLFLAATVIVAVSTTVNAQGMPCTEDTLRQFQANKAVADQELAQAEALKVQADANVAALKAQGVTGLQLLQATDAATNAANIVAAYKGKVQNAQTAIDNISSRGATEQYYLDMETKWKNRANLDSIKVQLDGQNQITAAALEQLRNLQAELLKQQTNAASNPSFAASVAIVQNQVNAAQATYEAAKAKSDALAASYAQIAGTGNWATDADNAQYDAFVKGYAWNTRVEYDYVVKDREGKNYDKTAILWYRNENGGWNQPNEFAIRWFE